MTWLVVASQVKAKRGIASGDLVIVAPLLRVTIATMATVRIVKRILYC